MAKEIADMSKGECGVLAVDARRHGESNNDCCADTPLMANCLGKTTSTKPDDDLHIDVLVEDFCAVVQAVFPDPAASPTLLVRITP